MSVKDASVQFANYATSSAFTLTMNRTASDVVTNTYAFESELVRRLWLPWVIGTEIHNKATVGYLLRRGLIQPVSQSHMYPHSYCLTKPGLLVAQLLNEAGFGPREGIYWEMQAYKCRHPSYDYNWTVEKIKEHWGSPQTVPS